MANEIHIDTSLIDYTGNKNITRTRLITPVGDITITDAVGQKTMNIRFRDIGTRANFGGSFELEDNAGNIVAKAVGGSGPASMNLRVTSPGSGGDFGSTRNTINFTLDPTAFATGKIILSAGGFAATPSFADFVIANAVGTIEDAYTDGGRIVMIMPLTCIAV